MAGHILKLLTVTSKSILLMTLVIFSLASCMPATNVTSSTVASASKNIPDRWRLTCVGGAGAMSVPIFWDVKNFNEQTGQLDLILTDRDGLTDRDQARIFNNKIEVSGMIADLDQDYNFSIDVDICPGGMVGVAL